MCAFKKRQKLPVAWEVFLQIYTKWKYQWNIIRVCYNISFLKMFLTILEDGGKITRFWGELTTRTHHVKLSWEKQSSPNSTPVIFRVSLWDWSSWNNLSGEIGDSWIQKYIVGYQRNTWYKHRSSPRKINGFNKYFYLKLKNTRSC